MSVALNCEVQDDSGFVLRAMKTLAHDIGMVPEDVKFSDFNPAMQSRILRDAQNLKSIHNLNRKVQ